MSSEKVQSIIPPPEALECSYENYLAEQEAHPSEETVCSEKAQHHYDPINQICEPEVVAFSRYEERPRGRVVEVIEVDEEAALERQAQRFQETSESRPVARESAPRRTEHPEEHLEAEAGRLHNLPHSHEEEEALPGSAAPVSPIGEAQALPVLAGADLCYCFPGETSSVETRRNPGARGMVFREGEPVGEGEPEANAPAVRESNLPILGAWVLVQDVRIFETVIEEVVYEERAVTGGFLAGQPLYRQIRQEMTGTTVSTEDPPSAPSSAATAHSPVETVVHSAHHFFQYFAPRRNIPSDPSLSVPQQGGLALFVLEGEQTVEHIVIVLPPSALPSDQVRSSGHTPPALHGPKFSFSRVNGGSDSQGSGRQHPGQHSGGRQQPQRH